MPSQFSKAQYAREPHTLLNYSFEPIPKQFFFEYALLAMAEWQSIGNLTFALTNASLHHGSEIDRVNSILPLFVRLSIILVCAFLLWPNHSALQIVTPNVDSFSTLSIENEPMQRDMTGWKMREK